MKRQKRENNIGKSKFEGRHVPVVNSTGSEVRVKDSDDGRCSVSQNGIVNDIQEVNQL